MSVSFYHIFFAIAVAFALAYKTDQGSRTKADRDRRRGYALLREGESEDDRTLWEGKARYRYGISPALLPAIVATIIGVMLLRFGPGQNFERVLTGYAFAVFLPMTIYYALLLAVLPRLREHIRPIGCASLWLLPDALYIVGYRVGVCNAPRLLLPVPQVLLTWLFRIWLAGFLLFLTRAILSHMAFRRLLLAKSQPCEDPQILEQFRALERAYCGEYARFRLLLCPVLATPLSIGLTRGETCVVLPDTDYGTDDLDLIFRHELIHICRGDASVKFFLAFCAALCWFNPLMPAAMRRCAEDLELSCDELVLADAGDPAKSRYASLILETAGENRGFTTCLAASASSLKYRLLALQKPEKALSGAFLTGLCTALLILSLGLVCLTTEAPAIGTILRDGSQTPAVIKIGDLFEQTGSRSQRWFNRNGFDEQAILVYLDTLECREIVGVYALEEAWYLSVFIPKEEDRYASLELSEHYAAITTNMPFVRRYYALEEPADFSYLRSLFY